MKKASVLDVLNRAAPGVLALLDPDRMTFAQAQRRARDACASGVKGILVGTSLIVSPRFEESVAAIKRGATCPVILFPGGSQQVARSADAIFFLSLLSGRNPEYLIGEHIKAVFLIRDYGLEVIPVGYLLVESGRTTAVEYVSQTRPIPRDKPEIAVAHALAGEYLGVKCIYLEAGSGARQPVPAEIIRAVRKNVAVPLIVGGGIRTARAARKAFDAGADYIVLGSIIERSPQQFRRIMRRL